MKLKPTSMAILFMAFTALAFVQDGSIVKGKINPVGSWAGAWIKLGTDTLRAVNLSGSFEIPGVPAGTHQLFIDGAEPYRDTTIVVVVQATGQEINVGKIHLSK